MRTHKQTDGWAPKCWRQTNFHSILKMVPGWFPCQHTPVGHTIVNTPHIQKVNKLLNKQYVRIEVASVQRLHLPNFGNGIPKSLAATYLYENCAWIVGYMLSKQNPVNTILQFNKMSVCFMPVEFSTITTAHGLGMCITVYYILNC